VRTVLYCESICCPAEEPIIRKILMPVDGVRSVKVNAITRTIVVLHCLSLVNPALLCKLLNHSNLKSRIQKTTADLDEIDHADFDGSRPHNQLPPWNVLLGSFFFIVGLLQFLTDDHGGNQWMPENPFAWFRIASWISILLTVFPILHKALISLSFGLMDTNVLMSIAVIGAIVIQEYFEASAVVILFSLADFLQARASEKAKSALAEIIALRPEVATLANSGEIVNVEKIKVGTEVIVKSGDKIPLDGVIVSGETALDESNLTGESRPLRKGKDDKVFAGTVNVGNGFVIVKSTALSADSSVSKLGDLVEQAANQRSDTEQFVETVAKIYTPLILLIAILFATIPCIYSVEGTHAEWAKTSLVLLVIACPCALVISTPITYVSGLTEAARHGILIKGGRYLEALGRVAAVALDKTGTLTEGVFTVAEYKIFNNRAIDEHYFFSMLLTIEQFSSHPIAVAICNYSKGKSAQSLGEVTDFQTIKGQGIRAQLQGKLIHIGNRGMLSRLGIEVGFDEANWWEIQGGTIAWVVVDRNVIGVLSARDVVRREAAEAVALLQGLGLRTYMLTGDNQGSAESVRRETLVEEVFANLTPNDKVARLLEIRKRQEFLSRGCCGLRKGKIATFMMVGDGVNDAPALALADVGFAMGSTGTVVALETADGGLMDTDLRKLHKAIVLGRACVSKINQNIFLSIVTKLVVFSMALVGYQFLWLAIVTDVGTMLLVTLNSVSLLTARKTAEKCDHPERHLDGVHRDEKVHNQINKAGHIKHSSLK